MLLLLDVGSIGINHGMIVRGVSVKAVVAALESWMMIVCLTERHFLLVNVSECEVEDNGKNSALCPN